VLISETVRTLVHATSLVVGIVGTVAVARHLWRFAGKLPRAAVVSKRSIARTVSSLIAIACLPLGIAAFVWASSHRIEVVLVRDGHSVYGDLAFDKRFGSSPLEFRLAKGSKETDEWFGAPCWTVNASSKPIRLVKIEYPTAYAHYKETESIAVLPGERVWGCFYDYRGPEFAPPDTMQSMAFARMDFAEWLTWDP
jgi:hypothetical protein